MVIVKYGDKVKSSNGIGIICKMVVIFDEGIFVIGLKISVIIVIGVILVVNRNVNESSKYLLLKCE